jgi:hypothetical protein
MTIEPKATAPYTRRESLEDPVWFMGSLFTVLADSKETGGQFSMIEAFHVLEGETLRGEQNSRGVGDARHDGHDAANRCHPRAGDSENQRKECAMTEQKTAFDFEAMRRAMEESDADALIPLYADDAEVKTVNKNAPPSRPSTLRGKEEISGMLRDVCAREMSHKVEGNLFVPCFDARLAKDFSVSNVEHHRG